ncbi:MAG: hypothetical protein JWQ07_1458 [Ramlibacter sp.]|nr:hypothetical protein [Ramlibacter sp.]
MTMSMSGPSDTKEEHGSQEQRPSHDQDGDSGHSGEGAASALAHMISRGEQQRHQTGEADDAAGSRHQ